MEDVDSVTRLAKGRFRWRRNGDVPEEWETQVTEYKPSTLLAWTHTGGPETDVRITFAPLEGNSCWMVLTLEVDTCEMEGDVATVLGTISRRVEREIRTARDIIERRYEESKGRPRLPWQNSGTGPRH